MTKRLNRTVDGVFETDGPPMAYFSVVSEDFQGATGARLYFKYVALALGRKADKGSKKPEELIRETQAIMRKIRKAVKTAAGDNEIGIIFWRQRPVTQYDKFEKAWVWFCRLATSPPMPMSFWDSIHHKPKGAMYEVMES